MTFLALVVLGCKGSPTATPTVPTVEADADTDTDTDSDTDADADADADTDTDTDADTDVSTGDTAVTCGEDDLEPNDALSDAVPAVVRNALWVQIGAPDFYAVDVPPGHLLEVTATHVWLEGDIDVYVVDPAGLAIGTSGATVSDVERASWCNEGPTAVTVHPYVEVWRASLDTCNRYALSYTLTAASCGPIDTGDTGDTGSHTGGDTGDIGASTGDTGASTGDTATP